MKKLIEILALSLSILLCLTACGAQKAAGGTNQGINGVWPDYAETAIKIIKQAISTDTIVD